jgi:2-dehydro-3-deoxygluconokinase
MKSKVVCLGEVLLRLNAPHHQRFAQAQSFECFYAGSEANVAVLLAQLGASAAFVTKVPDNDLGTTALKNIHSFGIDTKNSILTGDRMGLYFTELGTSTRPSRVIYDRTNSSFANLKPGEIDWGEVFEGVSWFHWSGISAAVSQSAADVCAEAIAEAKKRNMTISVDFNYRSKLWQYGKTPAQVMPSLLAQCDVILCDFDAVKLYLGLEQVKTGNKEEAFKQSCPAIKSKLPSAKTIAMTFRENSASGMDLYSGAVFQNNQAHFSKTFSLGEIIDRIGSGDAFMGGLIYALMQGWEAQRVAQFAAACGVLKHSMPGDFTILKKEEVESFLNQEIRGRIIL